MRSFSQLLTGLAGMLACQPPSHVAAAVVGLLPAADIPAQGYSHGLPRLQIALLI
jgi:hypothetical protein